MLMGSISDLASHKYFHSEKAKQKEAYPAYFGSRPDASGSLRCVHGNTLSCHRGILLFWKVMFIANREIQMSIPSILLADDQEEMRRTVAHLLEREFHVVGTVENGERVLQLVQSLAPDILVLDISMPVLNGIEAAIRLKESGSQAKVIFLTVHEDADFLEAARSVGALGYVLKSSLAHDLVPAVRRVLEGNTFVSPRMHLQ
jgi:CheY-like chemotaxis protein